MSKVLVGMSGGVDSAVAAAILKSEGHEVVGLTLKLLEYSCDDSPGCCTASDIIDATRACDSIGIEHVVISRKVAFKSQVIDPFLELHKQGVYTNPCVTCNAYVKAPQLLDIADHMGFDYIATGHYANRSACGNYIVRGNDRSKDQSYFLWDLPPSAIGRLLLPLGTYTKAETRKLAKSFALKVATKKDSTDLCFLEGKSRREFLTKHGVGTEAGNVVDSATGAVLGTHNGLARFSPGQRYGVDTKTGKPRYVLNVLPSSNTVQLGPIEETFTSSVRVQGLRIRCPDRSLNGMPLTAVCRYSSKQSPVPVIEISGVTMLELDDGDDGPEFLPTVMFDRPINGVANGQSIVLYDETDGAVVGGGTIVA